MIGGKLNTNFAGRILLFQLLLKDVNLQCDKFYKHFYSELKLIEAIHEPHICDEIKKYNVHAERIGSLRYAKGMSETMSTLHGLK